MEIRRFNEGDWRCFGGAVRFSNGKEPWILEDISSDGDFPITWFEDFMTSLSVIAGKEGIEIVGINGGMVWHPTKEEMGDETGHMMLKIFSVMDQISYEAMIRIGFREY